MKEKFDNKILVPIDFTDTCLNALYYAIETAKKLKSEVIMLHVFNNESRAKMEKEGHSLENLEEKLINLQNKYTNDGVYISYMIRKGNLTKAITETAIEQKAFLMILATHGKHGLQHLFGSYALKVVTKSPVPTLVVQDDMSQQRNHKIVFPISNFTEARQKVQWTVLYSKLFDSSVHILRQKQNDTEAQFRLKVITEQIEEEFKQHNVEYTIEETPVEKHFPEELINYAKEIQADMIAIITNTDVLSPDFNHVAWDEKVMFNKEKIPVMMINPQQLGEVYYEYLTLF